MTVQVYRLEAHEVRPLAVVRDECARLAQVGPDWADVEAVGHTLCPRGHVMRAEVYLAAQRGYRVIGVCDACQVAVEV